jgi:tRNA nucleotidyltransferase (CCA-adding enzyme)
MAMSGEPAHPDGPGLSGASHFPHDADVGVRGKGRTRAEAFQQTARALCAAVTELDKVEPRMAVPIRCEAPGDRFLLVDWINALIYEMAVRSMLFSRFSVRIEGHRLEATAWGEPVDRARHAPAVEPKGATYTAAAVRQEADGMWIAECVVDV